MNNARKNLSTIGRFTELLTASLVVLFLPGCSSLSSVFNNDNSDRVVKVLTEEKPTDSVIAEIVTEITKQTKSDDSAPSWLKRTDISFEGTSDGKPIGSIETVQPIFQTPDKLTHTYFWQGRYARRASNNTYNVGTGYRYLNDDNTALYGINIFYDRTSEYSHQRVGLGLELVGELVTIRSNYYNAMSGSNSVVEGSVTQTEQALDGFDYEIDVPVPYAPWLRLSANGFKYEAVDGQNDLDGERYAVVGNITPNITLELGATDDNYNGTQEFAKLTWRSGEGSNNGIQDSLFGGDNEADSGAFKTRDLKKATLDKVRRNNDVIRQVSGGVVIGRTD